MTQLTMERDATSPCTDAAFHSDLAVASDRRAAARQSWSLPLRLNAMGRADAHLCKSCDIAAGGVFVEVPADYGLVVGQRCEVMVLPATDDADSRLIAGETRYATVVRTERLPDSLSNVGAGLRFDQPLYL